MDETRLRAVIREEIALAVKTLHEAAGWTEADEDALIAVRRTAESFECIYLRTCEAADAERATVAENPFEEPGTEAGAAVDPSVRAYVHAEVQNVLREMRDQFYGSGGAADYRIGERLDHLIAAREEIADE